MTHNSLKADETAMKKSMEIRNDVRLYIRNERDTVLKKWMALEESVKSEDYRREKFLDRRLRQETYVIPLGVRKLIGNLKKAVHKIMRDRGGTPFSILRKIFVYWDSGHLGFLSEIDFKHCIKSLGIEIQDSDLHDIHSYYSNMHNDTTQAAGMRYSDLLEDIQANEPSIVDFVEASTQEKDDESSKCRFEEVDDHYRVMPERVKFYIEALREYCAVKMRNVGGTPFSHIRSLFMSFDFDYSGRINAKELLYASHRLLKLELSIQDAQAVIDFYDRKKRGEILYSLLVHDVAEGMTSVLSYIESTPKSIAEAKHRLAINPLYPIPFQPTANKQLESIKQRVQESLVHKMRDVGGSYKSWIADSFRFWDPRDSGYFNNIEDLKGFFKRLGVILTTDEANNIMNSYDPHHTGKLKYKYLQKDLIGNHNHTDVFFNNTNTPTDKISTHTSRQLAASHKAPHNVRKLLSKIQKSLEITQLKANKLAANSSSGGYTSALQSRDILHGTFLRFDVNGSGRVNINILNQVLGELKIANVSVTDVQAFASWFDTNGSNLLDYNELVKQLFNNNNNNSGGNHINSNNYNNNKASNGNDDDDDDVYSKQFMNLQLSENQLLPFLETTSLGKTLSSNVVSFERLLPHVPSNGNDVKMKNLSRLLHLDDYNNNSNNNKTGTATTTSSSSSSLSQSLPGFTVGSNSSPAYLIEKENKKIKLLETRAIKEIRRKMMQNTMQNKKKIIQTRLDSIELQRKEILDRYAHKINNITMAERETYS